MEKKKREKGIHMGQIVRARVEELGVRHSYVARKLNTQRQTMNNIYKRREIDVVLLQRLSHILGVNFFQYYVDAVESKYPSSKVNEPVELYSKKRTGVKNRMVIDFEDGSIINVKTVTENIDKEEDRILQLERLLQNMIEMLADKGIEIQKSA